MEKYIEEWWVLRSWDDVDDDKPRFHSWLGPYVSKDIAIHEAKSIAACIRPCMIDNDTIEVIFRITTNGIAKTIVPVPEYSTGDGNG